MILSYLFNDAVADEMVYQFLTTPTASAYFSSLILNLKNKCLHVDAIINGVKYVSVPLNVHLLFPTAVIRLLRACHNYDAGRVSMKRKENFFQKLIEFWMTSIT